MAKRYDKPRFREMVLYITTRTKDDPGFGDVHLNKALFHSDFTAFSRLGESITGAAYRKRQWGPAANALLPVRREMVADGLVKVTEPVADDPHRITIPLRAPQDDVFSPEQLAIVDEVIDGLTGRTAKQVSDESHEHPGWQIVELDEEIPYTTGLISTRPVPDEVKEAGRSLATRFGW